MEPESLMPLFIVSEFMLFMLSEGFIGMGLFISVARLVESAILAESSGEVVDVLESLHEASAPAIAIMIKNFFIVLLGLVNYWAQR